VTTTGRRRRGERLTRSSPWTGRPWLKWAWVGVPLASLGMAAFMPPLYFAARHGRRSGYAWSAALFIAISAFFIVKPDQDRGTRNGVAEALIMLCWIGGAAVAAFFVLTTTSDDAIAQARRQRKLRKRARALVARDAPLAVQAHIGRPDLYGDHEDGGLVDVNRAPADALAQVPGIDRSLAERIVAVRHDVGGFASLADLITTLDLNPTDLDDAAEVLVFIPL
jgi:hypothetical protein